MAFARWSPRLALCRAFVQAAVKAGVRAEVVLLPDVGFHGNSHMLMQEKNNAESAEVNQKWLVSKGLSE